MARWLLLLVALTACRDKAEPPAPAPAPAPLPAPKKPATPTPVPVLPGSAAPTPRALPADQAFAAEQPDPDWTPRTEKMLRDKLPGARVECRTTVCEVQGDDAMKLDAQLQGLRDIANSVLLTQGGSGETRAYVRFDR